jgi:hypothetical protein
MTYKLAPHVTAEMLEEVGFEYHYDDDVKRITSYCRESVCMGNELMVAWEKNCAYEKGTITMRFNNPPVLLDDVKDLIEKGYVIEE